MSGFVRFWSGFVRLCRVWSGFVRFGQVMSGSGQVGLVRLFFYFFCGEARHVCYGDGY